MRKLPALLSFALIAALPIASFADAGSFVTFGSEKDKNLDLTSQQKINCVHNGNLYSLGAEMKSDAGTTVVCKMAWSNELQMNLPQWTTPEKRK